MRPSLLLSFTLTLATALAAAVLTAAILAAPAQARIQEGILCYEPDFEWPVPCDDDD